MKKYKKALPLLVTAGVILLAAAVGVTLAYMFKRVEQVNTFEPATVTCAVHEKLDGAVYTDGTHRGGEKSDIRVENTGNVDAYLRVRLISYWVTESGEIVGLPSALPAFALDTEHWVAGADDTYYYQTSVKPGDQTEPLSPDAFTLREQTAVSGDTTYTAYQVIEVFAEAVQANPADAVAAAWGITVKNGRIQ